MLVYVLLFNPGTDNEGIHTVQMGGRNKILLFASEDDAIRYALMLEAQDFPNPSVESIDSDEIAEFCREANYEWELVEAGMLAIPPDANIEDPDWNPDGNPKDNLAFGDRPSLSPEDEESELPQAELDRIRRQLEGLL
jgi:hypothetical protein